MVKVFMRASAVISNLWESLWRDAPGHFVEACAGIIHTIEAWLYDAK